LRVYSIPSRYPTAPQTTPRVMKPTIGLIKNVPIPVNSINEAINVLAMVDLEVTFDQTADKILKNSEPKETSGTTDRHNLARRLIYI